MTSSEIEAFLAVCEYKNISRAAQALFISQSSLSTRVRILEQELGCPLLLRGRGRREMTLTEQGEKFYPLALEYAGLVKKMQALGGESKKGRLRVSSSNSLGTYLFTKVYERFMETTPGAVLEIQDLKIGSDLRSVEEGMTDLAFVTGQSESPKVLSRPVFAEPFVLVCAAGTEFSGPVELSRLRVDRELYVNWCDEFIRWHRGVFGAEARPQLKLEIMSQLEFFVMKKESWAVVPASVARGLAAGGAARCCAVSFPLPRRVTHCLFRPGEMENPFAVQLLCCLREVLANGDFGEIEVLP